MFPIFIQRTSNAMSAILNHKCNCKVSFLRLYKRSYFRKSMNRVWDKNTLDTFQKYPEKYKYFICYQKYSTELREIEKNDAVATKEYISDNSIVHGLLAKSVHYQNTIMQPNKANVHIKYEEICELYTTDWSEASTSYIYDAIKKISYCHLSGTRFETALYDDILRACTDILPELTDVEVKSLMRYLCTLYYDINKSYYWKQFLTALNKQCLKRFFPSKTEEMLLLCDGFYQLGDSTSNYRWRALRKLGSKIDRLSAKHLVQYLFLVNYSNMPNSSMNLYTIELRARECISDLSANEIGILARGFFMSKRKLVNHDLLKEMIVRVTKNVRFMESNTLAALMKLIRYTGCKYYIGEFKELLNAVENEIPRLPLKCLTHIAHAFGGIRIYKEPLITQIVERAKKEVTDARVKDIERILFAIYSVAPYNDYYQEACNIFMKEILETYQTARLNEIQGHPISLVRVITYAISRDIHIPQLIQYVLNPKYVHNLHQGNTNLVTSDMLTLECSVKIEVPDYKGPFLTKAMHDYLIKEYLCKSNVRRKWSNVTFQTDITYICKQFVGIDVYIDNIMPHYPEKDLIFGFDEHNNPVEIEPILSRMPIGSIKYVNTENLKNIKWNVLYPLSVDQKLHGRDDYVGSVGRKLKQLRAIGYTPIVIDEAEWNSLIDDKEKEDYLRSRIYENL